MTALGEVPDIVITRGRKGVHEDKAYNVYGSPKDVIYVADNNVNVCPLCVDNRSKS